MVMSDRICLMNNARIEQIGTPDELYFRPRSVFAADFLGESNLLPAVATGGGSGYAHLSLPWGGVIKAVANEIPAHGTSVTVMVRPESIQVLGDGESADNTVTGTVIESILTGNLTKSYIALADKTTLKITQLTAQHARRLQKGQQVRLGWQANRSVAFEDAKGDAHEQLQ